MKSKVTALLPLKHHSERVPGKNYRNFAGLPLFMHILKQLQEVKYIDKIIIDTDSDIIMEIAKSESKVLLLERPRELLGGHIPMNSIINHDIASLSEDAVIFQTHSTNPMLTAETISKFIEDFFVFCHDYDSSFMVTERKTRFWTNDAMPVNHDPKVLINTQDLEGLLEENSCGYLFRAGDFRAKGNRIGIKPKLYPISSIESIDIDTEDDYIIAESIFLRLRGKHV